MPGETELNKLLKSIQPILYSEEYVFCTVQSKDIFLQDLDPVGTFKENKGLTLILPKKQAEAASLAYTSIFHMITLSVHSSLEAVGFLAAITSKLAENDISVNSVSAYYHDHLFVPIAQAEKAMKLLQELSS